MEYILSRQLVIYCHILGVIQTEKFCQTAVGVTFHITLSGKDCLKKNGVHFESSTRDILGVIQAEKFCQTAVGVAFHITLSGKDCLRKKMEYILSRQLVIIYWV